MKAETRFNAKNIQLDIGKECCNHPILHPTLHKNGFHTGFYVCLKCGKIIKDTIGTLLVKELFF